MCERLIITQLKNSSYVYHMSYAHGISNTTGELVCNSLASYRLE